MSFETKKFDAEVGKVLQLMIHSLYTNKDIFLRELISNASDACDKLRYAAINDPKIQTPEHFEICVSIDQANCQISISDNGIGMNKEDMIQNLGTIASSGTQRFIESMAQSNSPTSINQIGQFGVGFYSAFIIAKSVRVISKKADSDTTYEWSSNGMGEYSVGVAQENIASGTKIILSLKDSEVEYLEKYRLKHIISTYSDHISFPIKLVDSEGHEEVINTASALWARPKSEISEENYNDFYHHIAHMPDTPWMRIHTKAEGNLEYTSLLYIPSVKPFDLFHPDRKTRVKLYVKRVFITEESVELLPAYLRFMRGIVDSEDLPLNISRETLQYNVAIDKIKKSLVKKVLSELKTKAKNDPKSYMEFWKNFGEVLKEGLCEGAFEEKEKLLEVCRFFTTKSGDSMISMDQYIDQMVDGQDQIFYITGDKLESLASHPQLEGFAKRNIEVLLLPDHVDDFWVNVINVYKNKELKSVNSQDVDLNAIEAITPQSAQSNDNNANEQEVIDFFKQTLGATIKEVKMSTKLVDSPACLSVPQGAMSIRMERYLLDQKQLKNPTAKILEINPSHGIISRIMKDVANQNVTAETSDLAHLVYDQACVLEGEVLQDPVKFMKRMNAFLAKAV